jgi:hypothetical protein
MPPLSLIKTVSGRIGVTDPRPDGIPSIPNLLSGELLPIRNIVKF